MSKLHRLPTGTWIDLSLVVGIIPLAEVSELSIPVRIYIHQSNDKSLSLPAESFEDAQRLADELAALVNPRYDRAVKEQLEVTKLLAGLKR